MCTGYRLVSIASLLGIWIPRYVVHRTAGMRRGDVRSIVRVSLRLYGNSPDRASVADIVWRGGSWRRGKGTPLVWVEVRRRSRDRRGRRGRRDRRWNRVSIFEITGSVRTCPILLVEVHHPIRISFLKGRSPYWVRRQRTTVAHATAPIRRLAAVRRCHAIIRANAVTRWQTIIHCALETRAPSVPGYTIPCSPGEAMWRYKAAAVALLATEAAMKTPAATIAAPTKPVGLVSCRVWALSVGAVLVQWAFFGPVAFLPAPITTRSLSHSRRGTQAASRKLHAHQFALRKRKT